MTRRARPLSPEQRRASIIAATLPLLRLEGRGVTTAQIAMAAGVSEGTLFRVFPDKDALVTAAIAAAFDPSPTEAALGRIDTSLELRDQLIEAVEIMQSRMGQIWQLISMLGMSPPPPDRRASAQVDDSRLRAQLAALFEPFRDELRCEPAQAARLLRALAFGGTHPRMTDQPLTAGQIVTVLLDGIRARPDEDVP